MENKNKFVDIKLNEEIYEILKLWNLQRKQELKEKNWGTREPIFKVQTRQYIPSHEDFGHDKVELCLEFGGDFNSFKDLDEVKEYYHEDYFSSKEDYEHFMELVESSNTIYRLHELIYLLDDDAEITPNQCYLFYSQEVWKDQAYFLTYKEAEDYKIYQSHNLGVCRIYVDYPGYANRSTLNKFLEILDHKEIFEVK